MNEALTQAQTSCVKHEPFHFPACQSRAGSEASWGSAQWQRAPWMGRWVLPSPCLLPRCCSQSPEAAEGLGWLPRATLCKEISSGCRSPSTSVVSALYKDGFRACWGALFFKIPAYYHKHGASQLPPQCLPARRVRWWCRWCPWWHRGS